MSIREPIKHFVNGAMSHLNVRLVNLKWGPRGPFNTLRRIRERGFAPDQVVDVGASDGGWTVQCLEVFPKARYFMVDALVENAASLQRLERMHSNVAAYSGVIGAARGTSQLFVHGDQSSLFPSKEYGGVTREVPVRTLDSFWGSEVKGSNMLIKADVQGYELEVLKGGATCLQHAEVLLLEVSFRRVYADLPLAHEVIAYVGSQGFRIYDICTYSQRPHDLELTQSDIIFARNDSGLFAYEGWS